MSSSVMKMADIRHRSTLDKTKSQMRQCNIKRREKDLTLQDAPADGIYHCYFYLFEHPCKWGRLEKPLLGNVYFKELCCYSLDKLGK